MRCIRHGLCCPTKRASRPSRTPGQRDTEAMQSPGGGGAGGALPQTPEQKYRLIYLSAQISLIERGKRPMTSKQCTVIARALALTDADEAQPILLSQTD